MVDFDVAMDIKYTEFMLEINKKEEAQLLLTPSVTYSPLYTFSNEPLKEIYEGYDLSGKRVLTTASGGDHALSTILHGATEIDIFDINRVTKYFVELKVAALKALSFEGFCGALNFTEDINPRRLMRLYEKIQYHLSPDAKTFWNYFFDPENIEKLNYLSFRDYDGIIPRVSSRAAYVDSKNFDELKEKIQNASINYIQSDVTNLPNVIEKKYDHINLSNIMVCCKSRMLSFFTAVRALQQSVNPGGNMNILHSYISYLSENAIGFFEPLGAEFKELDGPTNFIGVKKKGKILVYQR